MKIHAAVLLCALTACGPIDDVDHSVEIHQRAATHWTPYSFSAVDIAVGKQSGTNNILVIFRRKSDNNCTVTNISTTNTLVATTVVGSTAIDYLYLAGDARNVAVYCANLGTTYTLTAAGNPNNAVVKLMGAAGDDAFYCWSENGICWAYGNADNDVTGNEWFESRTGQTGASYRNKIIAQSGADIAYVDVWTDIDMGPGDDCFDASVAQSTSTTTGGTGTDRAAHAGFLTYTGVEYAGGACPYGPGPPHPVHSEYCCMTAQPKQGGGVEGSGCVDYDEDDWDMDCDDRQLVDCDEYNSEILIVSGEDAGDLVCQ